MKGVLVETIIRRSSTTVRSVMAVKNGVAWAEDTKYAKPYYKWFSHYERVPRTREIVTKGEFIMQLGMMEGDCDECHQSPCPHIAFLLGWTKE